MRTIEEIFSDSYHIGTHYNRFKIIIVGEYGPDFSVSQRENTNLFREHMHSDYIQEILNAFEAAAKELNLPLGRVDRAEFFAYYIYYWYNKHYSEIKKINAGEEINPEDYLRRLVENLNAGLVLSAGGVGEMAFRQHFEFNREGPLNLPIFCEARREDLKELFKVYIKNCRSSVDEAFKDIAKEIAKGKSPLDVFDKICNGAGGGTFNTYPGGSPSGFHPELFVICEDPMNLAEFGGIFYPHRHFHHWHKEGAFNYIDWWCDETTGRFPARRVMLLTDKWTTEAYKRYENSFRRFAKKYGVKFEFYLYTLGALPVKINLPF